MAHRHSTRERRLVPRFVCMSLVCLVWSVVWVCVSTLGFAVRLSCGVHGVHYRALKMLGENEVGLADGGCRCNHFDPLVGIFPTMGVSTIRTITRSRMVTDRPTDQNTDRFVTVAQCSGTIGTDDDLDLLAYECPITGKRRGVYCISNSLVTRLGVPAVQRRERPEHQGHRKGPGGRELGAESFGLLGFVYMQAGFSKGWTCKVPSAGSERKGGCK